ncbi:hypothetical protein T02_8663, partial [Trichinella nativa]
LYRFVRLFFFLQYSAARHGCNLPETSIWTVQLAGDANQSKTDEPFQMVQNFSVSRQASCQQSSPAILLLTYQPVTKIMEQKNYEELQYL